MSIWGKNPKGGKWKRGVTDPFHKDSLFAIIPLSNSAVVTSGNYEKFVIFNGIRYSHIINPQTGYPACELSSVTVLGPSAEIANGFSTSLMVMGKDAGLQFINKHPEYKSIIFSTAGQIYLSDNLPAKTIKKWKRKI